jgi:hypothetical protein
MVWYENPKGSDVHWPAHTIAAAATFAMEYGIVVDLFGDGRPVALMGDAQSLVVAWYVPGPDPTQPWVEHPISPTGFPGAADAHHGMGAGDIDGDGKLDVLTPVAWFQQTADRDVWIEHPLSPSLWPSPTPAAPLTDPSRACSRMWAYDVNCDGLADILCTRPHDYGVYWIEQVSASGDAGPTFVSHTVDTTTTSEMHALMLADLDGDGVPELVTGKRWYAELPPDPDAGGDQPPLLIYYAMRRTTGGAVFDEHTLDDASGVGAQFSVQDIDGDGKPDIVVENKTGLHYFLQR